MRGRTTKDSMEQCVKWNNVGITTIPLFLYAHMLDGYSYHRLSLSFTISKDKRAYVSKSHHTEGGM
jgi:hypothetical protein